jgi:hypothetical protein
MPAELKLPKDIKNPHKPAAIGARYSETNPIIMPRTYGTEHLDGIASI